jgi:hypothetical protein
MNNVVNLAAVRKKDAERDAALDAAIAELTHASDERMVRVNELIAAVDGGASVAILEDICRDVVAASARVKELCTKCWSVGRRGRL